MKTFIVAAFSLALAASMSSRKPTRGKMKAATGARGPNGLTTVARIAAIGGADVTATGMIAIGHADRDERPNGASRLGIGRRLGIAAIGFQAYQPDTSHRRFDADDLHIWGTARAEYVST
jgi:hypothetical protein